MESTVHKSILIACITLMAATLPVAGPIFAVSATSAPCVTWLGPASSLLWKTVTEMPVPVSVDWPDGAQTARLTAVAGSTTLANEVISDRTVSIYRLNLDLPQSETDECVVDLQLDFLDGESNVLSAHSRTAQVALVRGTCGNSFRCMAAESTARKWAVVESRTAVVPVPEGTLSLSLDGASQDFGTAPGWLWIVNLGVGSHMLVKTSETSEYEEASLFVRGGFQLRIR